MSGMTDEDRDLIMLSQPAPAVGRVDEPDVVGLHLVSDKDIETLKQAASRLRDRKELPEECHALLEAVDTVLIKGGWGEKTVAPVSPAPMVPLANELPEGEVVEGHSLSRPGRGVDQAVNKPQKSKNDDEAGDDAAEQKSAAQWSGDNVAFPIELMGILHDSIRELAETSADGDDNPARDALMGLIDQMEGILEALPGSENLELLNQLKRRK
ncbi:hypothetical protein [Aestuariispira insulae]|uniref:Uncharacterized protein n=1 Tax=Aestuariispira insulae TaxID=1461337 RepID=A0A3D9HXC8_9PROT|nr:hypothetical protein [Aestuariispira insulae]RED54154.1 hypothetical protein DFP90_101957 [Aestuariispira insulae]